MDFSHLPAVPVWLFKHRRVTRNPEHLVSGFDKVDRFDRDVTYRSVAQPHTDIIGRQPCDVHVFHRMDFGDLPAASGRSGKDRRVHLQLHAPLCWFDFLRPV